MSSEKPASAPPGSASSLTDTDRDPHPGPGSSAPQPQQQQQVAAAVASSGAVTGERMVSAAGSMVLPAGAINPAAVPIRNIQMKFAVLVGLIQVGEVSNRDIVETVLNLVSVENTEAAIAESLRPNPLCFIYDASLPWLCGF
ncbi:unnamed protein product [Pleuronectes platessa]|uniref:Neurobeachin n=1 Tax=Pleuronectes platessa TaxID=8262 RepID=A0A9N7VZT6_PLEPL|nr:unnamed protein product [Pleuronectes platessa]